MKTPLKWILLTVMVIFGSLQHVKSIDSYNEDSYEKELTMQMKDGMIVF